MTTPAVLAALVIVYLLLCLTTVAAWNRARRCAEELEHAQHAERVAREQVQRLARLFPPPPEGER